LGPNYIARHLLQPRPVYFAAYIAPQAPWRWPTRR